MILGFNSQFIEAIKSGKKIHTIREDKHDRWTRGRKIHFASGVRTKNYFQFKEGECFSTQKIEIKYSSISKTSFIVFIDGYRMDNYFLSLLAKNDGFENLRAFSDWFNKDFEGKIIHWTRFKY